jgi:nicotinamide mononucleotide transporter
MSWIEWTAALLGIVCVALGALRSIWNYAFGIASVALLGFVFFEAKLYSDALLQIFFIAANCYGLANWLRSKADSGDVIVETMSMASRLTWTLGSIAAIGSWGWLMHRYTDASYPWPDAAIAITSVVAQILMAQRKFENWILWIAVDIASIPLYAAKALWVPLALYVVYLGLAIWGFMDWYKARRTIGPAFA